MRYITSVQERGAVSIPDGTTLEAEELITMTFVAARMYGATLRHCFLDAGCFELDGTTVFYSQLLESA